MNQQPNFSGEKDRPAYVRFERRAIEDRMASLQAGHYVAKDEDFAIITPVGSKDEVVKIAGEWLQQTKQQVREGRMNPAFAEQYQRLYEAWKRGEEAPPNGTAIKDWQVLSPAQRATVLAANVRTVEDLAAANGEALTRIGMGANQLKQKAETWLKAAKDVGVVVQANTALQAENERLKASVADLSAKNAALASQLQALKGKAPAEA